MHIVFIAGLMGFRKRAIKKTVGINCGAIASKRRLFPRSWLFNFFFFYSFYGKKAVRLTVIFYSHRVPMSSLEKPQNDIHTDLIRTFVTRSILLTSNFKQYALARVNCRACKCVRRAVLNLNLTTRLFFPNHLSYLNAHFTYSRPISANAVEIG